MRGETLQMRSSGAIAARACLQSWLLDTSLVQRSHGAGVAEAW